MRIKIGEAWYDCNEQPIMVELTRADRENIARMPMENSRYAAFPDGEFQSQEDILAWMDEGAIAQTEIIEAKPELEVAP